MHHNLISQKMERKMKMKRKLNRNRLEEEAKVPSVQFVAGSLR